MYLTRLAASGLLLVVVVVALLALMTGCKAAAKAQPEITINGQAIPLDPALYGTLTDKLEFSLPAGYPTVAPDQAFAVKIEGEEALEALLYPLDGVNQSGPDSWSGSPKNNFLSPAALSFIDNALQIHVLTLIPVKAAKDGKLMVDKSEAITQAARGEPTLPWTGFDNPPTTFTFGNGLPAGYYILQYRIPIVIAVK